MIPNIAEYVDINSRTDILKNLFDNIQTRANTFGKTKWASFSLEDNMTGEATDYLELFEPILEIHRQVHANMQRRSTGFNTAMSLDEDLFAHTDIDYDQPNPNYFNLIIPLHGNSVIEYFETNENEVYLPEKNAHGYAYYHEFYARKELGQGTAAFENFLQERKIGDIEVNHPLLIDTNTMHRVRPLEVPRCAWVTRWNNIPENIDFQTFKSRVESILQ